jgi:purine-binding chemotaxis protein CheW
MGSAGQRKDDMKTFDDTIAREQLLVSTFSLGTVLFGLDTAQVQEVTIPGRTTFVHHAPESVVGIINLRGRIATVIDLAVRLGLGRVEPGIETRIFIVDDRGEWLGLLVDRVADAISIDPKMILPPPENVNGAKEKHVMGVVKHDGRLITLLNLKEILAVELTEQTPQAS